MKRKRGDKTGCEQKEQYLRRATRGLWGRKRLEVREELMNHIEDRTLSYRMAGMREGDALERTLQELGPASEVRTGMVRLYTLPTLLGSGALLAAACAAVVVLFSSSFAQTLSTTDRFPSSFCLGQDDAASSPLCYPGLWTNVEALREVLEPQGVGVTYGEFVLKLEFPDDFNQTVSLVTKTVNLVPYTRFFMDEGMAELPAEYQASRDYVPVWGLLEQIIKSGVEVNIEGWPNPRIALNGASFELDPESDSEGRDLYQAYLSNVLFGHLISPTVAYSAVGVLPVSSSFGPSVDENLLRIERFDLAAGAEEVYGVVVVIEGLGSLAPGAPPYREDELTFFTDVAPAEADGTVSLQLPDVPVTFVDRFPVQPELGTAVLVRLTGEAGESGFGYEVVSPERVR